MPSIDDNRKAWGQDFDWADDGDVWSTAWGGPDMQWYGALLARILRTGDGPERRHAEHPMTSERAVRGAE